MIELLIYVLAALVFLVILLAALKLITERPRYRRKPKKNLAERLK